MTSTLPLAVAAPRTVVTPDGVATVESSAVLAAHLLCQRALELAGKRLLNRTLRGTYTGDLRALHEQVPVTADQLPRLLAGAFDWSIEAAYHVGLDADGFTAALASYVGDLLLAGNTYDLGHLATVLRDVRAAA